MTNKLTCVYSGKIGTVEISKGAFGWYASFNADDKDAPGTVFASFGGGHSSAMGALQAALNRGLICKAAHNDQ